MTQDRDLDTMVRARIRGLRSAKGWSLDELARRCYLSASTLSRIETGQRRIALDQLAPIARALGTSLDQLIEAVDDEDVVIRPQRDAVHGVTTWALTRQRGPNGIAVTKMRFDRATPRRAQSELGVHPGRDWFTVLAGTAWVQLGERTILVETGQAAEFSTMIPHAFGAHDAPVEILSILDHDGEHAHLRGSLEDSVS